MLEELRGEIVESQKARTESVKWKLILVAAIGAAALGIGSTEKHPNGPGILLTLVLSVCLCVATGPAGAETFREDLRQRWDAGYRTGGCCSTRIRAVGYLRTYKLLQQLVSPWRMGNATLESDAPVDIMPNGRRRARGVTSDWVAPEMRQNLLN
jgi:hypothetical protein